MYTINGEAILSNITEKFFFFLFSCCLHLFMLFMWLYFGENAFLCSILTVFLLLSDSCSISMGFCQFFRLALDYEITIDRYRMAIIEWLFHVLLCRGKHQAIKTPKKAIIEKSDPSEQGKSHFYQIFFPIYKQSMTQSFQ
jgi:hypothetical protein